MLLRFRLVGLVACLAFIFFSVLGLLILLCYATICDACLGRFHLARLGLGTISLVWLAGSLGGMLSILSKKTH